MKKAILLLFCWFSIQVVQAQRTCHTMDYLQQQLQADPGLANRMQLIENQTAVSISNQSGQRTAGQVITIPVVVHVVYNTATQNISDAQIQSQIAAMNKDYRKLNTDTSSIPSPFKSLASDIFIQFALAVRDPNGNATNGITRTSTTTTSFSSNNNVKYASSGGHDAWSRDSYLNIWVCNLGSSLLGYAQFPGGAAATDGVVINYTAFGTTGTAASPFNLGRTVTHEVGHWLNLRHIWGDATCGDDLVFDTPTQQTMNYNCPTFPHVTCSNGSNGDMFVNYMDYTNDNCMYMFTAGQSARMNALFDAGGFREPLLSSVGLTPVVSCGVPTSISYSNFSGSAVTMNWSAVSGATAYVVQYKTSASGTFTNVSTTTMPIVINGLSNAVSYDIQVYATCASGNSNASTLYTFMSPGIVSQPTGTALCMGDSSTLNVSMAGVYSYSYQWYKNGLAISGATSNTYKIKLTNTSDTGSYVVTASQNGYSYTSTGAVITQKNASTIITQPISQTACIGTNVSLNVNANASGTITYQWYKNGVSISGASASTYSIASLSATDTGLYYVKVSGGCGTLNSSTVNVAMQAGYSITTQPAGATRPTGSSYVFSAGVSGSGNVSYQWKKDGVNISGATSLSYQLNAISAADAGNYTITVNSGCGSIVSSAAVLAVSQAPSGFEVRIENEQLVSTTEYQFDIMLYATSPWTSWEMAGFTVGIGVNPLWRNGATINSTSSSLLMSGTSDMKTAPNQVPLSATFSTTTPNRIQIASTSAPGAGNGTIITSGGKRLIRVRMIATSGSFSTSYTPDLYFLFSSYATSLSAYIGGLNVPIAGSSTTLSNGFKPSDGAANLKSAHYYNGSSWNQVYWNGGTTYASTSAVPQATEDAVVYGVGTMNTGNMNCRNLMLTPSATMNTDAAWVRIGNQARIDGILQGKIQWNGNNQFIIGNGSIQAQQLSVRGGGTKTVQLSVAGSVSDSLSVYENSILTNSGAILQLPCGAKAWIENGSSQSGLTWNNTPTTIISQTNAITACPGDSIQLQASGMGIGNLSWQWKKNAVNISGAMNAMLSLPSFSLSDTGTYQVVLTAQCGSSYSAPISVSAKSNCMQSFQATVHVWIEGFWNGTNMNSVLNNSDGISALSYCDSIQLSLMDSATQQLLWTGKTIMDTGGFCRFTLPSNLNGKRAWLVVQHRNSIETWSAHPLYFTSGFQFDFSSQSGQSFEDNMRSIGNQIYLLYSGDVDQDGVLTNNDMVYLDNDNSSMNSGYLNTDLNGDGIVTNDDMVLMDNNNTNFVGVIRPW